MIDLHSTRRKKTAPRRPRDANPEETTDAVVRMLCIKHFLPEPRCPGLRTSYRKMGANPLNSPKYLFLFDFLCSKQARDTVTPAPSWCMTRNVAPQHRALPLLRIARLSKSRQRVLAFNLSQEEMGPGGKRGGRLHHLPCSDVPAAPLPAFALDKYIERESSVRLSVLPSAQSATTDSEAIRLSAVIRVVLATVALVGTFIDPAEPPRYAATIYAVIGGYVLFSSLLLADLILWQRISPLAQRQSDWVDVAFCIALIGLSGGANSTYYTLLFFAILSTSFRVGFHAGLAVTTASVALFAVVGYIARPNDGDFDLNRFLLRSSALLLLGYMIAYWGGHELRLKRRLTLLKELSSFSNPRFGIDRTLAAHMEQLRAFFGADACLVVLQDTERQSCELRCARKDQPQGALRPTEVPRELAARLLQFPAAEAIALLNGPFHWLLRNSGATTVIRRGGGGAESSEDCREVAELLDATCFLSVPMHLDTHFRGRLYLSARSAVLSPDDLTFLQQAVAQITPVLDHIALVDRMAARASEEERQRIARDIHDRFIQPYIGIQLGISSLRPLVADLPLTPAATALVSRLAALEEMTRGGIEDLRTYVGGLRAGTGEGERLEDGLRRFAERFSDLTGIAIHVEVADDLHVPDQLGDDVFSLVSEGLSNIRRHTDASCGCVRVKKVRDQLIVTIENRNVSKNFSPEFLPASIAARAASLHGLTNVTTKDNGCALVEVRIPL